MSNESNAAIGVYGNVHGRCEEMPLGTMARGERNYVFPVQLPVTDLANVAPLPLVNLSTSVELRCNGITPE
jgi:hypothetical protein